MAQQYIDFGSFPDDPDADAIRTAFQKVQHNFTEVYSGIEGTAVSSIIEGAGIDASSPTGNVVITANIACVQVSTSTLSIGRGSNGGVSATITQSSQILVLDLPANISNVSNINLDGYATAVGNITGGNLNTAGQVVATGNITGGNLVTTGTVSSGNLSAINLGLTGNISAIGNASVGNISATLGAFTNVSGNGSALSSLTGANVTGQVANALVAGTVYTAAQPNITSVGTLTSLGVSGAVTASTLVSNVATGTAPFTVTSTTQVANLNVANAGTATVAGTVTTAAQPNITSVGTLSSLAVTANVTAGNVYANSGTIGASLLTGTLTTASQPNITSTGTLTSLNVSGNITAPNITANTGVFSGNGSSLHHLTGANVTGTVANATYAISAGSATTAGTVTTAAQPNITSVGTLTGLTASGTIDTSSASNVTLGNLANLHITGGSSGYTIKTDGAGNLSWGVDTAAAGGNNTEIQFNDNTSLNGSANYTFDKTTNQLTLLGNIQTNNANLGNAVTANYFTGNFYGRANTANTVLIGAQPNITSVGTLTDLTVSGTSNLGDVGNVKITGGSAITYLQTDGAGNLSWSSLVNTPPGGTANSIQYKDGSTYQGSYKLAFNDPQLYVDGTLNVTGNANVGNIGATNIVGTLATGVQTNITRVGTLANLTVDTGGFIIVDGYINAGNISGNIITGKYFSGNGNSISNITGANVTGAVSYATTANSVAGANVSGAVAYATTANSVAGANVSGQVNYAATANSVAGANVTGAVSYATTANSVAGANVSGQVNYAATANAVAGANVSGTVASANNASYLGGTIASSYLLTTGTGSSLTAINGANVTGTVANATYSTSAGSATTATSATTAGTVTTAAQPNITSVGTLTSLTSSGNVTGANIIATGYVIRSVGTGITAAGSTQGTATAITKEINIVSTVSSGTGVILPTAVAGMVVTITNNGGNSLLVYPASGAAINALASNAGFTQSTSATIQFIAPTTTQWYTVGATFA